MGATSPLTWVIIIGIALLLFGPKQLPKIAKSVGESMKSFKDSTEGVKEEVKKSLEDTLNDTDPPSSDSLAETTSTCQR